MASAAMLEQLLFNYMLVYSWALYMFIDRRGDDPGSLALYIATVAPAILFILISIPYLLRVRFQRAVFSLLILFALTTVLSVARQDIRTLISVGTLCVMIVGVRLSVVYVGFRLVNTLLLLSIVTCTVMHAFGLGQYGILPGQADDPITWRVSLFPFNVTPSWMFALVVIGLNYFHNTNLISRIVFVSIAFYFLALSASRTGLIVLLLWLVFLACRNFVHFRERAFYKLFIPCAVVAFVGALNVEGILLLLTSSSNPIVNAVLFKSAEGAGSPEQVRASIERTMLWASHAEVFLESPWMGRGTYDFEDVTSSADLHSETGSEAFITGLFARIGVPAVLFVYFIYLLAIDASRRRDPLCYCLVLFLSVTLLSYGSYFVPYDFVFMLVFGAMNYSRASRLAAERTCVLNLADGRLGFEGAGNAVGGVFVERPR